MKVNRPRIVVTIGAVVAGLGWMIGLPLMAMASPIPTDGTDFFESLVWLLVGVALLPVVLTVGRRHGRLRLAMRISGALICAGMIAAGVLVQVALTGALGSPAPRWVPNLSPIPVAILFLWIGASSWLLYGLAKAERSVSLIGLGACASFVVPALVWLAIYRLQRTFVVTNATIPLV